MTSTTPSEVTALEAPLSVVQDSGTKVVLTICIPGLKKRQSVFYAVLHAFRKPQNPFPLASNAKFGTYTLTSTSLNLTVDVYENKAALKKSPSDVQKQRYICNIGRFPTRINAESAQFELMEAASGECYFVMTCMKTDNYSTNWQEYLSANGTLDANKL